MTIATLPTTVRHNTKRCCEVKSLMSVVQNPADSRRRDIALVRG